MLGIACILKIRFNDIYGYERTKKDLSQIIDYLKKPEEFIRLGARLRRGVLLYGPSGTGKTMLAKALANEAGVQFIAQSASEFVETFVGVGPSRVRALFQKARDNSPCIVFIDELDALGARNTTANLYGQSDSERNNTINQILVEMDGFEETERIVVIAATNREKFLDFALIRSGRFDLKIEVHLPNQEDRRGIFWLKLRDKNTEGMSDEAVNKMAVLSEGLSGADIDAIINEAIYSSKDAGTDNITPEILEIALKKIKRQQLEVHNQLTK